MIIKRLIPIFALVLCHDSDQGSDEKLKTLIPEEIDTLTECP